MYLYCTVIVVLYCPLEEVFLCRKLQLGPKKVSVAAENCPLNRGFFKGILNETNQVLKKCPLEGGVRYGRCPL